MLAVVDTNVWISAALTPTGFCAPMLEHLRQDAFTLAVCPMVQRELSVVLHRPRFAARYGLTREAVSRVVLLTSQRAHWIPDPPIVRVSRDPRDDVFIAAAKAARAEYLVTRDDDLKRDQNVAAYLDPVGVKVVSVREFYDVLAHEQRG